MVRELAEKWEGRLRGRCMVNFFVGIKLGIIMLSSEIVIHTSHFFIYGGFGLINPCSLHVDYY